MIKREVCEQVAHRETQPLLALCQLPTAFPTASLMALAAAYKRLTPSPLSLIKSSLRRLPFLFRPPPMHHPLRHQWFCRRSFSSSSFLGMRRRKSRTPTLIWAKYDVSKEELRQEEAERER